MRQINCDNSVSSSWPGLCWCRRQRHRNDFLAFGSISWAARNKSRSSSSLKHKFLIIVINSGQGQCNIWKGGKRAIRKGCKTSSARLLCIKLQMKQLLLPWLFSSLSQTVLSSSVNMMEQRVSLLQNIIGSVNYGPSAGFAAKLEHQERNEWTDSERGTLW